MASLTDLDEALPDLIDAPAPVPTPTSNSDSDDESDYDETNTQASPSAEERVLKALSMKEEGNTYFKSSDYDKAARAYRRGVSGIKSLNLSNTGDEQVKSLLLTLNNNLAMVYSKLEKWSMVRSVTTNALAVDSTSVKALYRRGMAHKNLKNMEKAKADWNAVLLFDENNKEARRELLIIKQKADKAKKASKKAFGGMFDKDSSSLYEDKEEEKKKKALEKIEEEIRQMKKKAETLKKRKAEWETECVSRMARSEPAISYDNWDAEQLAKDDKEKEKRKKKKEEEKKAKEAIKAKENHEKMRSKSNATSNSNSNSDDDSDDDLILKNAKGYKTTSDGRKTSYFNNELSSEAKGLIGDIAPKRLSSATTITENTDFTPQPIANDPALAAASASSWNKAGTWEEKDVSSFCKDKITSLLEKTTSTYDNLTAAISEVKDVEGEGSVAVVRGKKRYLFDFHVKCEFEFKDDSDDVVAKGSLACPDVSSTVEKGDWDLEMSFKSGGNKPNANELSQLLQQNVKNSLDSFILELNRTF